MKGSSKLLFRVSPLLRFCRTCQKYSQQHGKCILPERSSSSALQHETQGRWQHPLLEEENCRALVRCSLPDRILVPCYRAGAASAGCCTPFTAGGNAGDLLCKNGGLLHDAACQSVTVLNIARLHSRCGCGNICRVLQLLCCRSKWHRRGLNNREDAPG